MIMNLNLEGIRVQIADPHKFNIPLKTIVKIRPNFNCRNCSYHDYTHCSQDPWAIIDDLEQIVDFTDKFTSSGRRLPVCTISTRPRGKRSTETLERTWGCRRRQHPSWIRTERRQPRTLIRTRVVSFPIQRFVLRRSIVSFATSFEFAF